MRVGVYGGSFDPPHEGHAHAAQLAAKALGLDVVIWLVAPQNPFKPAPARYADRLAAVRKIATGPVTGIENELGFFRTVETLEWFARRYPGVRVFWIMGADSLRAFHRWRRWRQIGELATIVVVPRPGSGARARLSPGARWLRRTGRGIFLQGPLNSASSTALRERAMKAFDPVGSME